MLEKTALTISNYISSSKLNSRNYECIILCDVGENFSNTKKATNNLLPEQRCTSNWKLGIRESMWKFPYTKDTKKRLNKVIIQLGKLISS